MIDTHAHLYGLDKSVLINMERDGLENIITISTNLNDCKKNIEISQKNSKVYCAVGFYPEYAEEITPQDLLQLEHLARQKKVVAIGEIGLDYHGESPNKSAQKWLFIEQLKLADRLNLPFCIHCRAAASDVYEILSKNRHLIRHSGLMHCYSEGAEWVDKFLELGLYISFSGNITFKNNNVDFIKNIPTDKILVETDSPYLSPVPFRGQKNEPKNVRFVITKIADLFGKSFEEFEKITSYNAKKFYGIVGEL